MKSLVPVLAFGILFLAVIGPARSAASPASDLVHRKAAVLELLHGKARKALVTVAQDRSFRDYFTTTSAAAKARLKDRIHRISLEVQRHFHVEEMCLIAPDGAEIARIANGAIAYDLDDAEHNRPFFRPAFALAPRTVHQSAPYMSDDAGRWVVSYTTPIVVDGETRAILHYEHGLGVYQAMLNKGLTGEDGFLVAVDGDDRVISDSRAAIPIEARNASGSPDDYFHRFEWAGLSLAELRARLGGASTGEVTVDGHVYDVALQPVAGWTLVAVVAR